MKKITIAIDGFSSCGKSTMAKDLAREIGYIYIDSGAMYRAVTLYCLENGLFLADGQIEDRIRTMEVSARVSPVSALPFVRQALVARQQEMGREKGIVMDGRDIGTTVFPDAELKVFVTAAPEIRARRRYDELKAKGQPADYDDILANVKQRDDIDQHRAVSPLRRADDALLLDNGEMTIEEQKAWLLEQYRRVAGE